MTDTPPPRHRGIFFSISLLAAACVLCIFLFIHPQRVQNIPVPNAYGPVLLLIWLSTTAASHTLFLQTRRSLLLGTTLTLLAFLRLQKVLTPTSALWLIGGALSIELSCTVLWICLVIIAQRVRRQPRLRRQRPTDLV